MWLMDFRAQQFGSLVSCTPIPKATSSTPCVVQTSSSTQLQATALLFLRKTLKSDIAVNFSPN